MRPHLQLLRASFAAFILCAMTHVVVALEENGFLFDVNGNGATITGYTGAGGAVEIPASLNGKSVVAIGDSAFYFNVALTSVTIPSSVTSIGEYAFFGCGGLTSVTITSGVNSIGYSAFAVCNSLTNVTVDDANPNYSSVMGVLFNKNQTTLILYPEGKAGSYTIPASVTSIEASAFESCNSLTSVTIPSSVTSIGDSAFSGCSGLTNATFLGNAPTLGADVFTNVASGFTVTRNQGATGFDVPPWTGFAFVVNPGKPQDFAVKVTPKSGALMDGHSTRFFGKVKTNNKKGVTRKLTITNTGTKPLTGLRFKKSGVATADFFVKGLKLPKKGLAPTKSITFDVVFRPTAAGDRLATLHITSSASMENPFDLTLLGTGVPPRTKKQ